ncbi:HPr Serine kinase C-terminal domain-containing protein [Paenibacillus sp. 1_12]|uniref:HPr kinase/phosphorylase n=1 Tax=Paenibacillus sp. 1_12 TaxID=1566278 RepID=UPI0008ED5D3C|nr:aldolase [Paenibacillus sp. 1_12]SFL15880.1 HPr Serine kinase C-terminal domain-containing protein [Paenibacillus sp. 1_12]
MLEHTTQYRYIAFGLIISSEILLPELQPISHSVGKVDVEIKIDDRVNYKEELADNPYEHIVKDHAVLFFIPDHAFFSISDGRTITIFSLPEADYDLIRLYILGSCMGALLMQRSIYPLHGSAVEIDGKAYAFIGESGAGKSTLASTFLKQGYRLVSDDVIAISLSPYDHSPIVTPSYPQQKLWQESLDHLGMDEHRYHSIFGREKKYAIPVSTSYYTEPLPLAGIFELGKSDSEQIDFRPIKKLERFKTLVTHTYRNFLIPQLGLREWHFSTSASIMKHVDMYYIRRTVVGFSASQLADFIHDTISRRNHYV